MRGTAILISSAVGRQTKQRPYHNLRKFWESDILVWMSQGQIALGPMRFSGCLRCLPSGPLRSNFGTVLDPPGFCLVLTPRSSRTAHTVAHPNKFQRKINPFFLFPVHRCQAMTRQVLEKANRYAVPQADRRRVPFNHTPNSTQRHIWLAWYI